MSNSMNRENCPLATDKPVEVEDVRKIADHFGGIYENIPQIN
jgi:hypothetical protein